MLMILVNSPFLQGELHWLHLWLHHNNILKHCRPNGFPCFEQSHWRDLIELQQPILEGIELVYNLGVSELNYTLKLSPSPRKCTVLLLLDDNVVLFRLTVFCNVRLLVTSRAKGGLFLSPCTCPHANGDDLMNQLSRTPSQNDSRA
ncbi:unnamed protein product [Linum tenue]|uniref:Uncharacterized protein n=1 Tax=Linum tenue TaxID=586396 RepID=A0AAV0KW97_9ROSI|nr:unnamed protein product [Linum tenue]